MDFNHIIKSRHSTTSFKKHSLSWKPILESINDTLQGPFAGNWNNLKFVIIEDSETIKKLSQFAHQYWISTASIIVLVCSEEKHLEELYGERGRIYSRQQAGAAINTLTMSLANKGIQSCWVGAYDDNDIRVLLKIPGQVLIEAMVPIGYSAQKRQHKRKKQLEHSIFWEKWDASRRAGIFEESEEHLN